MSDKIKDLAKQIIQDKGIRVSQNPDIVVRGNFNPKTKGWSVGFTWRF